VDQQRDIERIASQERVLVFTSFDEAVAWRLGARLREVIDQRGRACTIEVRLGGNTVFLTAMPGTTPANADWARRKRNTTELLHRSSYAVGLAYGRDGGTLESHLGLDSRDYASHGGAVPIRVSGVGVVGVVTVSGLPQRDDHGIVVEVLAELCGVTLDEISLD
jgi:uncharacterized protein (UPF0303 family)